MITWVLYDIKNDRNRTRAAKACMQSGLYRVQLSCFLGSLTPNQKDTLRLRLEELINTDIDKVYMFSMSRADLQQSDLLGQAFDPKLMTDEIRALFF